MRENENVSRKSRGWLSLVQGACVGISQWSGEQPGTVCFFHSVFFLTSSRLTSFLLVLHAFSLYCWAVLSSTRVPYAHMRVVSGFRQWTHILIQYSSCSVFNWAVPRPQKTSVRISKRCLCRQTWACKKAPLGSTSRVYAGFRPHMPLSLVSLCSEKPDHLYMVISPSTLIFPRVGGISESKTAQSVHVHS